jgi:hypothetical protein
MGAVDRPAAAQKTLLGTQNQIEWAERIRVHVSAEFDRVSSAVASVAQRQTGQDSLDSIAVVAILEEKRAEVLSRQEAGYFIQHWQELNDQVRVLIAGDARYQVIKANRDARRS